MKIIGYLFLGFILFFCEGQRKVADQEVVQIRVVNNSDYKITNVMIFSMPIIALNPKDSSDFKTLKYDALKDDPLLYLEANNQNFASYIKIPNKPDKYSYIIDSIQIDSKVVYVSLHEKIVH